MEKIYYQSLIVSISCNPNGIAIFMYPLVSFPFPFQLLGIKSLIFFMSVPIALHFKKIMLVSYLINCKLGKVISNLLDPVIFFPSLLESGKRTLSNRQ